MALFGPPNVEKLEQRRDIEGLVKALEYKKDDGQICLFATVALGNLRDARAVAPLIKRFKTRDKLGLLPNTYFRQCLTNALAKIGEPAVLPLLDLLQDADSSVRTAAARALGKIGDTRAAKPLIAAWDNGKITLEPLTLAGDKFAQPIIAALSEVKKENRTFLEGLLKQIGPPKSGV
jgi:HEAT repeat protein